MRHLVTGLIAWVMLASCAFAAPQFPALTGRIVDNANILSPPTEQTLSDNLEAFEQQTKHQLVVVTLPSLQGYDIADYGYQLGRHWGIGRKGANDGSLLIVAPNERKVRIEVGYGLEGDLTDALSSHIIQAVILPEFKRGDLETGVVNGARAIISVLSGEPFAIPVRQAEVQDPVKTAINIIVFILMVMFFIIRIYQGGRTYTGSYGSGWTSSSGRSSGGSSFSGGGGSFGGGGSSGSW